MSSAISMPAGGTNGIIADIYSAGGTISPGALLALVKKHGYDGRTAGILHGRRAPHLRRDLKTGNSVLMSRGEEVAKQHLFVARLAGDALDQNG